MHIQQLFQRISASASPSGYEDNFRSQLKSIVLPLVDSLSEDIQGNLICYKYSPIPEDSNTIMFIAHMDEVGLMVSYIEDDGFIRFTCIGGVDLLILIGRKVKIIHDGNEIPGVIGTKPFHMKRHPGCGDLDESELWIDIGASGKAEVEKKVSIGDCIIVDSPFTELQNGNIASRACDDKAGVVALINLLEQLKDSHVNSNIAVVFSVQEELGLRGAKTASFFVSPDVCIAVDVAHATDYPSINRAKYGDIRIGKGPVIPCGSDLTPKVQNTLRTISQQEGIPFQQLALSSPSGTDSNVVQLNKSGCATGLIAIPCRYMHSPVEVISPYDIECITIVLSEFCKKIDI